MLKVGCQNPGNLIPAMVQIRGGASTAHSVHLFSIHLLGLDSSTGENSKRLFKHISATSSLLQYIAASHLDPYNNRISSYQHSR